MGLVGRRVLITGASAGVGLEPARRFAAEGAHLALVDAAVFAGTVMLWFARV